MKPTRRTIESRLEELEITLCARPQREVPTGQNQEQVLSLVFDSTLPDAAVAEQVRALGGRQDERTIARIRELLSIARERKWRHQTA